MEVNNELTAARIRLAYIIAFSFIGINLFYYLVAKPFGISLAIAGITFIIGLITYIVLVFKKMYYVQVKVSNQDVMIRYFHVHPFLERRRMVVIPVSQLQRYEITGNAWRRQLVLYQKTPRGVAKYPPISLAAFTANQYEQLKGLLNDVVSG